MTLRGSSDSDFTAEQKGFIRQCIGVWLDLSKDYNKQYEDRPSVADAHHSALLGRLLDGKEPFAEPPPRAFSYPWYALLEANGSALRETCAVSIPDKTWTIGMQGMLVLNQAPWRVVDQLDHREYVIEWEPTGLRCNLRIGVQKAGEFYDCELVVLNG